MGDTDETSIVMNTRTTDPFGTLGVVKYFYSARRGSVLGKFSRLFVKGQCVRFVRVIGITARLVDENKNEYWVTQHCRVATPEETAAATVERERRLTEQKALTTPAM